MFEITRTVVHPLYTPVKHVFPAATWLGFNVSSTTASLIIAAREGLVREGRLGGDSR